MNNYQLRLIPASTTYQYAAIQSIYNTVFSTTPPLVLQPSGGNVGIGITNPFGALTVSGLSLLNRIATFNNTFPDLTAVNNSTTHSIINLFPGINGQQGALTADLYNIYLSSFAYANYLSGPQPYITVNCTMLYNGSNT